jgi:hypothetical protein
MPFDELKGPERSRMAQGDTERRSLADLKIGVDADELILYSLAVFL